MNIEDLKKDYKKTKAILVVHAFGYPANMTEIKIVKKHKLKIIEDVAEATRAKVNKNYVARWRRCLF